MKDNEKKGSGSKNRQEISVKEDPKLRKLKELPSEVLAAAIRDAMEETSGIRGHCPCSYILTIEERRKLSCRSK